MDELFNLKNNATESQIYQPNEETKMWIGNQVCVKGTESGCSRKIQEQWVICVW